MTPPPPAVNWPRVDLPPLRPAQRDAVAAWRAAGGRGQVIMPTGTGKTEVVLAIMAESPVAILVVAPVRDLIASTSDRVGKGELHAALSPLAAQYLAWEAPFFVPFSAKMWGR